VIDDAGEGVLLEQRAFALRKQHFASLAKYASALGASVHDAGAVADDAILDLVIRERRDDFAPLDNLEAWLITVVKNKVCDLSRQRDFESTTNVQDLVDRIKQTTFSTPERRLDTMEVLRALKAMPETYRVPVELASQGYSAKEIGAILGLSELAAWQRVSRGRKELKTLTGQGKPKRTQNRIQEGGTE
jgi:RNA polymerase sigma factor (sigma-70 family)